MVSLETLFQPSCNLRLFHINMYCCCLLATCCYLILHLSDCICVICCVCAGLLALLLMVLEWTRPGLPSPLRPICDLRVLNHFIKEARDAEDAMVRGKCMHALRSKSRRRDIQFNIIHCIESNHIKSYQKLSWDTLEIE